jgi:hypothetical protein
MLSGWTLMLAGWSLMLVVGWSLALADWTPMALGMNTAHIYCISANYTLFYNQVHKWQ